MFAAVVVVVLRTSNNTCIAYKNQKIGEENNAKPYGAIIPNVIIVVVVVEIGKSYTALPTQACTGSA